MLIYFKSLDALLCFKTSSDKLILSNAQRAVSVGFVHHSVDLWLPSCCLYLVNAISLFYVQVYLVDLRRSPRVVYSPGLLEKTSSCQQVEMTNTAR